MECISCGQQIDHDASFCNFCGLDIREKPGDGTVKFGRTPDNDIVIDSDVVSIHHCRLMFEGERITIYDLKSTNGTYVNGKKIQRSNLRAGDEVRLGSIKCDWEQITKNKPDSKVRQPTVAASEEITIGRNTDNQFVLDFPQISGNHAVLIKQGGIWYIEDVGSLNGTYINSRSNRLKKNEKHEILPDDIIYLGSYKIAVYRIIQSRQKRSVLGKSISQEIMVCDEILTIGRDPNCNIVLEMPTISWHHASIVPGKSGCTLKDLDSTNGTYVNGERIIEKVITPEDKIMIGSYQLGINKKNRLIKRDYRGDVRLDVENISIVVEKNKTILDGINMTVYPSEFIGLMGPSGAGKTTLLMALNGYSIPSTGRVMINGLDLAENYNNFRNTIGYVPQDDIIHGELTVYEALQYTANLRFSSDVSQEEIDQRINSVLESLGIYKCKDTLVGSAEKKGISGGQRKRVNLAMELLTDPSLLFLDEPTSGLSSEDTITVMDVLRKLADEGKTIILTIHQPSLEAYKKMDNIIILDLDGWKETDRWTPENKRLIKTEEDPGRLAYYGPAYPDSLTFFNPDIPEQEATSGAEYALKGLARKPVESWTKKYRDSEYYNKYVKERREEEIKFGKLERKKSGTSSRSSLRQWWVLVERYFTIKRKDFVGLAILLSQAPIIAMLIALVFEGTEMVLPPLFLLSVAALWFGTSNSAREIVAEKAIYTRERMVNLQIPSYVLSKFFVLAVLCLIQCVMMVEIVHLSLGLEASFLWLTGITYLASLAGLSIGLCLSSMVKTSEAAIGLVPLVLLPMVILAGGILPVKDMNKTSRTAALAMPSRWAYEGMIHIENDSTTVKPDSTESQEEEAISLGAPDTSYAQSDSVSATPEAFGSDSTMQSIPGSEDMPAEMMPAIQGDYIDRSFGDYSFSLKADATVLTSLILLFLMVSFVALKMKDIQ